MNYSDPPHSAVGPQAVKYALQLILKEMKLGKACRLLFKLNQEEGIDCPGCAWPDPAHRSRLGEYCENGVKAIAEEAMDANADAAFFSKYSVEEMRKQSDYWLGHQGRLVQPMIIEKGETHYRPIEWETVFSLIAGKLNALASPHDAVFYTSGRTSNEAAFLYQLFVRILGTNNLPDCSNMCHESSGVALNHTLGIGKGSVLLEDFYKSELILVIGQNPGTNHPRMLSALEKAKQNGAKVVAINPLKEPGLVKFNNPQRLKGLLGMGTDIADLYLQVKINEDVSLIKAVLKQLLSRSANQPEILDGEFIRNRTEGYDELVNDLSDYSYEELVKRTGLQEKDINTLVELVSTRSKIIICWAMGLTQHVNAVDNIQELVNLLLLKGSIGKEGAGTCPVRGHSNVQGDRTMGIWERPTKEFLDTLSHTFGFDPPREHGVDVVGAIEKMMEQKGMVFMSMGGNFLSAAPDTPLVIKALQHCGLTVHVSTKLNRSHLYHGDTGLILPCLGRTDRIKEKSGVQRLTVENSMGIVHSTAGNMIPRSSYLLSEPHIIAKLAAATLGNEIVNWQDLVDDYDKIRELIAKSVKGFEDFNKRLKEEKLLELPNGPRKGQFTNKTGKAKFTINRLPDYSVEDHQLLLMTIRSHDQFNTTIYGMNDRYRGISDGRNVVFMNREDITRFRLNVLRPVTLTSNYDNIIREVSGLMIVPYDIPAGCIAAYYPETNPLVPLSLRARISRTPASKSVVVEVKQ